ncbi:MAG TPA: valine--tRNA ligase, partial [Chlamydiales bacterium]|nr:valine--tRNA ligase [Chlamydiales bacterium]
ADDEVEYEEKDSHLWYFRYPVQDSKDYVIIATTRPETMLGDTALAVSPKDPRYQHLIGKNIILPIQNREIPVVADNYVDPEFGSGIVKITPAHDPNDYELGFRHNLPMINIMNPDGTINENGAKFEGLSMQDARKEVVAEMEKLGLLEKIEPYKLRVGVSYRSKAVIEPYLSKQWFVKMSVFKDKLISAVKEKRIELIPENFEKTYFHWIENLRDWCISRQLWWGHRIPIWYHKEDPEKIICHVGKDLPEEVIAEPDMWQQDEDVLDTWFSSGLWPFSVLGWPNQTDYLKKFYPTSVLVTGHDILFFWVARMIMMGEYVMEEIPFHKTFLHGLIYGKSYWRKNDSLIEYVPHSEKKAFDLGEPIPKDVSSKWEKMSKSKGNVIDPLEIIDEYGTDAMRIALCASTTHARQIDLDLRRFEEYRNFANKLWNGSRFILMNIAKENGLSKEELEKGLNFDIFSIEDRWILSLTNRTIENMRSAIDQFHFDKAASIAYDFFWNDFCAYYLELVKPYLFDKKGSLEEKRSKMKLLLIILIDIVRLLHPITPYITEEIFSLVKEIYGQFAINSGIDPYTKGTLNALNQIGCIVAPYPKVPNQKDIDSNIENTFAKIQKIILQIRNIRGEMSLPPSTVTDLYIHTTNAEEKTFLEKHIPLIETLIRIGNVHYVEKANLPKIGAIATLDETTFSIPLPHDLIEKEIKRLSKEQEKLEKAIESAKKKLSVQSFIEKAPSHVVEKMQETLKSDEETLCIIKEKIQTYQ